MHNLRGDRLDVRVCVSAVSVRLRLLCISSTSSISVEWGGALALLILIPSTPPLTLVSMGLMQRIPRSLSRYSCGNFRTRCPPARQPRAQAFT